MSARESIALSIIKMNMKRAQEIIDEAIFSHEGCFDANDLMDKQGIILEIYGFIGIMGSFSYDELKKHIAVLLESSPEFKRGKPSKRVKLCDEANTIIDNQLETLRRGQIIEYVGNGKYIFDVFGAYNG